MVSLAVSNNRWFSCTIWAPPLDHGWVLNNWWKGNAWKKNSIQKAVWRNLDVTEMKSHSPTNKLISERQKKHLLVWKYGLHVLLLFSYSFFFLLIFSYTFFSTLDGILHVKLLFGLWIRENICAHMGGKIWIMLGRQNMNNARDTNYFTKIFTNCCCDEWLLVN